MSPAIPDMEALVRERWGDSVIIEQWDFEDLNGRAQTIDRGYAGVGFTVLERDRDDTPQGILPLVRVGHCAIFDFVRDEAASKAAGVSLYRLARFQAEDIAAIKPGWQPVFCQRPEK
jgi:hypothetical protein